MVTFVSVISLNNSLGKHTLTFFHELGNRKGPPCIPDIPSLAIHAWPVIYAEVYCIVVLNIQYV